MTESPQQDAPSDPLTGQEPDVPTFAALILANLRVMGAVALLAAAAWGTWYGLSKLFPDQSWLQVGQ